MKKLAYTAAALACLMAAPVLITPAAAQVSIGVGRDGPRIELGREGDRGEQRYRGEDRGQHEGFRNQADCREVTVQTRRPDGSVSVRTTTRCD